MLRFIFYQKRRDYMHFVIGLLVAQLHVLLEKMG